MRIIAEDVKTGEDLLRYVRESVPLFLDPILVGPGEAFHYTYRAAEILASPKLLGAPVSPNLATTQQSICPPSAKHDPGVVFAYQQRAKCEEEGKRQQFLRIRFQKAVSAMQKGEKESLERDRVAHGFPYLIEPTLLIMTGDIERVDLVSAAT
jgi:hypothetical protein